MWIGFSLKHSEFECRMQEGRPGTLEKPKHLRKYRDVFKSKPMGLAHPGWQEQAHIWTDTCFLKRWPLHRQGFLWPSCCDRKQNIACPNLEQLFACVLKNLMTIDAPLPPCPSSNRYSCSPGWPRALYVDEDDLEFPKC